MYSFSDSNRTDYITLIANIYTVLFTPIMKANNSVTTTITYT